jgi:hypothetical protein
LPRSIQIRIRNGALEQSIEPFVIVGKIAVDFPGHNNYRSPTALSFTVAAVII